MLVLLFINRVLGVVQQMTSSQIFIGDILVFSGFCAVGGVLVDRRMFGVMAITVLAAGAAALMPHLTMVIVGTTFCFSFFAIAYIASTARALVDTESPVEVVAESDA